MGKCLVKAGQIEAGLEYIEKVREAFHAINEPGMQGHCLFAKATALKESDPIQARDLLEQARSIYTGLDWSWPLDKVLVSIADLDLAAGNSAEAIATYEQVLVRAKELSRHGLEQEVEERLSEIAQCYR